MNWLDWSIVIALAFSVVCGIRNGLSRSGFGFLALLLAFVAAAWIAPDDRAVFLAWFIGLLCAAGAVAWLFGKTCRRIDARWLDQAMGGFFGLVNAAMACVVLVVALLAYARGPVQRLVAGSAVAPLAVAAAREVEWATPPEVKARVEESLRELGKDLPPKVRRAIPPLPSHEI